MGGEEFIESTLGRVQQSDIESAGLNIKSSSQRSKTISEGGTVVFIFLNILHVLNHF